MIKTKGGDVSKIYNGLHEIKKGYNGNTTIYSANGLPSGFHKVDYIEGTGTQYIVTDIIPQYTDTIQFRFRQNQMSSGTYYPMTCIYTNENKLIYEFFVNGNTQYAISLNGTEQTKSSVSTTNELLATVSVNKTIVATATNTYTITESSTLTNIPNTIKLAIFAYTNKGGINERHMSAKLYEFRVISKDGTVTHELVPCYKIVNGTKVGGLYDKQGKVFYTNKGNGQFILPTN